MRMPTNWWQTDKIDKKWQTSWFVCTAKMLSSDFFMKNLQKAATTQVKKTRQLANPPVC